MQNESKLRKDFWDTIINPKKVNLNLLTDDDIETYTIGERKDVIMVIYVPMAKREQKPIYINNDIFNGTFRRNYEGDYHCTRLQVKAMLRDQTERTMNMEILEKVPMEDLNYDTIYGYRNSHKTLKEGHPFERLNDHEYLRSIGAAAVSEEDGKLHPTAAGMLYSSSLRISMRLCYLPAICFSRLCYLPAICFSCCSIIFLTIYPPTEND